MAGYLKQSTATTLKLGPFIDNTDFITAISGLSISASDVKISKNGGTLTAKTDATSGTYDTDGYYAIVLSGADVNTLGRLRVEINKTTALPVRDDYDVLSSNVYDSIFGTTALAVSGGAMSLLANQDIRNVLGTIPNVVLSANQPYYAPAKAGDEMTIASALSAEILKHSDLIDGKSVDYILQATMAMVNGDFEIVGDRLTLYKRDGITPFSVIDRTATTRERVS